MTLVDISWGGVHFLVRGDIELVIPDSDPGSSPPLIPNLIKNRLNHYFLIIKLTIKNNLQDLGSTTPIGGLPVQVASVSLSQIDQSIKNNSISTNTLCKCLCFFCDFLRDSNHETDK